MRKIAVIFGSSPDFDPFAFKYFVLSLNKIQSEFEFCFPDADSHLFEDKEYDREKLFEIYQNEDHSTLQLDIFTTVMVIIAGNISGSFFSVGYGNVYFVTTAYWERVFSPPSLFEYLLHSLVFAIIGTNTNLELETNKECYGCVFDYNRIKMDCRVGIAMGYISDTVKNEILSKENELFFQAIQKMIDLSWLGDIEEKNSVRYKLKHYFKYDIDKDSGFKKSFWEKAFSYFESLPSEMIKILVTAILSFIFGALIVYHTVEVGNRQNKTREKEILEQIEKLQITVDKIKVKQ